MIPSPEEKARMDRLLEVFHSFIANNSDIDIVYSEKIGYVRLVIAENADSNYFPIQDFDELLQTLLFDVLCLQVDLALAKDPSLTNETMDYSSVQAYLTDILNTLDQDHDYTIREMHSFLTKWKTCKYLP